MLRQSC